MTSVISALTARTQLGQIIRRASQKDERFVVGRRGEPKIIIMGLRDYIKTLAPAPRWLREVRAEARRKGLDQLSMREINREVAASRRARRTARKSNGKPSGR
jgi:prevent-host-death family protein